jgi:hypothetical protein
MDTGEHSTSAGSASLDENHLVSELKQALQATIFTSSLRIAPRRVHQIAQEIAAAFRRFLEAQEHADIAYTYGQTLAGEGISHQAILALIDALHRICWESAHRSTSGSPVSVRYGNPLLAGYMAEREASLLREQERTRLALERARAHDAY